MTTAHAAANPAARIAPFAGLATLLRFTLRRDRIRLPVWILGLTAAIAATAASYPGIYATVEERYGALLAISNPGTTALIGAVYGEGDYTYGIMVGHQLLAMTGVVAALMSIFTVVRHTRAEEESGRAELIRSSVVGRHASATSALLIVLGANIVLAFALAASLASLGSRRSPGGAPCSMAQPPQGSVWSSLQWLRSRSNSLRAPERRHHRLASFLLPPMRYERSGM